MSDALKISVITVTKNAEECIARCIRSVQAQTYNNCEHVLVDGASTDGTMRIVRSMARLTDKVSSEADDGIYHAMNRGVSLSTGDYVLFMGADDFFYDAEVLADAVTSLATDEFPELLYGGIEVRAESGDRHIFHPPPPEEALDFLICGCLPHQATFAQRRMFTDLVGMFDTRYRIQSDYDWFLRAVTAPGVRIRNVRRIISSFALGGASSRLEKSQAEVYAIQDAFGVYNEPEWVRKRLGAFQRETLSLRLRMQHIEATRVGGTGARAVHFARRVYRKIARTLSPQ